MSDEKPEQQPVNLGKVTLRTDQAATLKLEIKRGPAFKFLCRAYEFYGAGHALLEHPNKLSGQNEWRNPVYHLINHSIELVLKAYLFLYSDKPRTGLDGHKIDKLFVECVEKGLKISLEEQKEFSEVIRLLNRGNEDYGFRYPDLGPETPDARWARDISKRLIDVVNQAVSDAERESPTPFEFYVHTTLGKPGANR